MFPPISDDAPEGDDRFVAGSPEAVLATELRDAVAAYGSRVCALLATARGADSGLAAFLEDIGNRFIDMSEHVNASARPARNRPTLRLVSG